MATILLVDNDPLQAFLRKAILEQRFRDVLRVGDAAEAFCLVEQPLFAGNLGLVISGKHVPGMDGPAFVAELHARLPRLPVLVLGNATEAADDYSSECVRFLAKPIATQQMVTVASQMLAERDQNLGLHTTVPLIAEG